MTVVKEAIADYKSQVSAAWDLNPRLQELGKQKVSLTVNEREHLPRAEVSYQFKSSAGTVKVNITTAGENYTLEIKAGKNSMAAQLACIELEKQLTFIALTA
jgi:archaellum component FlaF (FlaF/FlaG flagellin family)